MNHVIFIAFLNTLDTFAEELIHAYPQEKEFVVFRNTLKLIRKANPRKIPTVFQKYITPFVTKIKNRDEAFFLNESYSDIVTKKVSNHKQQGAWTFIENLKHYWNDTSHQNKEAIWNYLNTLITLSEKM